MGGAMTVVIPIRLESVSNLREHWSKRARRTKAHRGAVSMFLGGHPRPALPVVVTLTRIAPRPLDKHDNLRSSAKAAVDAVAAWLGVADNHPSITWTYAQERGAPRAYAVRIEVVGC